MSPAVPTHIKFEAPVAVEYLNCFGFEQASEAGAEDSERKFQTRVCAGRVLKGPMAYVGKSIVHLKAGRCNHDGRSKRVTWGTLILSDAEARELAYAMCPELKQAVSQLVETVPVLKQVLAGTSTKF